MGKVFTRMDKFNREDNRAALSALANQGISFVDAKPGEVERWRKIADQSVDEMIAAGIVSREVVGQVREHLQKLRNSQ
jgi:hypothetical protein